MVANPLGIFFINYLRDYSIDCICYNKRYHNKVEIKTKAIL